MARTEKEAAAPKAIQYMSGQTSSKREIAAAVDDMMTFHKWTDEQLAVGAPVRKKAKELITAIITGVPPGPDRSDAIRSVRNALYAANGAITHKGRY